MYMRLNFEELLSIKMSQNTPVTEACQNVDCASKNDTRAKSCSLLRICRIVAEVE